MRLNGASIIGFGLVGLTLYHPFFHRVFDTTSIPLGLIWIVILWNIGNVLVVEIAKFGLMKIKR